MASTLSHRKERTGTVVSCAGDKTIVVKVTRLSTHPRYRKLMRRGKKYHAHDERNEARTGDVVTIVECRPTSKMKRWRLLKVAESPKRATQTAPLLPSGRGGIDEGTQDFTD